MDGNGRWASKRGLPRTVGHEMASRALIRTVHAALAHNITWLTVYAFSTENWNRPESEVKFLLNPARWILPLDDAATLAEAGVRIRVAGERNDARLPAEFGIWLRTVERPLQTPERLNLTIAFNYGARTEIVQAVSRVVAKGLPVSEHAIDNHMYVPESPDLDLIVRTSGEQRLSNFMLWRASYAELVFTGTLWPDFTESDFDQAVAKYSMRQRRWGTVQLQEDRLDEDQRS